jgi:hypothetical protein
MTNQPAVQRSTPHAKSEWDAQTSGQIGGRAAGEVFVWHSTQKTKEDIRLALPLNSKRQRSKHRRF